MFQFDEIVNTESKDIISWIQKVVIKNASRCRITFTDSSTVQGIITSINNNIIEVHESKYRYEVGKLLNEYSLNDIISIETIENELSSF